jgi:pSer/pThr/pTyr-binding forkhead associated (FHA) protein
MREIKIGRTKINEIAFPNDTLVSRSHAIIYFNGESYFLEDLASANGTFVNGNRIHSIVQLDEYDIVKVGNSLVNWKEIFIEEQKKSENFGDQTNEVENETNVSNETTIVQKTPVNYALYILGFLVIIVSLALAYAKWSPI